jgi:hypothetical protein
MSTRRWGTVVGMAGVGLLLALGCTPGPRAPALQDGPIYSNPQEGFHFVVPDGWKMRSRAEVAPGKLTREHLLVEYKRNLPPRQATLQVSMHDLPPEEDLAAWLDQREPAPQVWKRADPPEMFQLAGLSAVRVVFAGQPGREPELKEVTAVRRGERVYVFSALFAAADARSRQQVRRAVESLSW